MKNLKMKISSLLFITLPVLLINPVAKADEVDAVLMWSERVELSTPVAGIVSKIFSETGKVAAKGEVLVQLDPRLYQAELKNKQAQLDHALSQQEEMKRELARQTDMYERTMLSEHELQVAKNNLAQASALYRKAQAELTEAKLNLEYSAVRAPFNAIVVKNNAVTGMVVNPEIRPNALVTVAEANRMVARGYVVASKINTFSLNQGATVSVAGVNYNGQVSMLAMEQDAQKPGLYAVDVTFSGKDFRAGQLAKISF